MADAPTNIRALQAEHVLELTWNDRVDRLHYRQVRGECPCASCRDEWTGARILDPAAVPAEITLTGMDPVGSYAVRLAWSDGHGSGLYTWEMLCNLAAGPLP